VLVAIERRRRDAQGRLEQLRRRRAPISGVERADARDALRSEAVAIRSELARLDLLASLTTRILQPLATRRPKQQPRRSRSG
jgi:hypothetical protein